MRTLSVARSNTHTHTTHQAGVRRHSRTQPKKKKRKKILYIFVPLATQKLASVASAHILRRWPCIPNHHIQNRSAYQSIDNKRSNQQHNRSIVSWTTKNMVDFVNVCCMQWRCSFQSQHRHRRSHQITSNVMLIAHRPT